MHIEKDRRSKPEEENYSYLDKSLGTIYIVGEITQKLASVFRQQLRTLERLKKFNHIIVEINSLGGDIEAGFLIIDSIDLCSKPVTTRVTGQAMSMGALILAAGVKREALPNAQVMLHPGSYRINAKYDDIHVEYNEVKRVEQQCNDFLDQRTGKESGYWEKKCSGKNVYLSAQQCIEENLVHLILTKKS